MNLENIIKGWFTTLIGCALMALAVYEWFWAWTDTSDWWDVGVPFIGGFALLYMRDKVSEFIGELFKALLNKITGSK